MCDARTNQQIREMLRRVDGVLGAAQELVSHCDFLTRHGFSSTARGVAVRCCHIEALLEKGLSVHERYGESLGEITRRLSSVLEGLEVVAAQMGDTDSECDQGEEAAEMVWLARTELKEIPKLLESRRND